MNEFAAKYSVETIILGGDTLINQILLWVCLAKEFINSIDASGQLVESDDPPIQSPFPDHR